MSPAATLDVHPPNGPASAIRPKSQKEMTKAERRELQEQQRAAKAAKGGAPGANLNKGAGGGGAGGKSPSTPNTPNVSAPKKPAKGPEQQQTMPRPPHARMPSAVLTVTTDTSSTKARGLLIFSHFALQKSVSVSKGDIHPAIARLALLFSNFKITGANARCIATLTAFKSV